ncbi:MAG TPA: SUMF1/EgtB/PvdO family nonheme iron enzyme [Solirubrobacter sp.]|nr:SUMF1/EgtB/PvdO family nonheme iron enzyme [Solirubrobacter sp.]
MQDVMEEVRDRTWRLVEHLDEERLNAVLSPIMSPLSWDLGHVAAYEDLWLNHRASGRPLLREDLAALYDAFETPRSVRGDIDFLRGAELREYMEAVRERALQAPESELHELVIRHELQHTETMLQAMALADLLPPSFTGPRAVAGTGTEMVEVPEGPVEIGSQPEGFAYDNERPRHMASTGRFTIARTPVTNATWLTFAEGGGYERREWWSDEGWAWKEDHDITHHAGAEAGEPDAPAVHVSFYEAEAFARANEARLPTEIEWEKAATSGLLDGLWEVWEWTSSHFTGYPGFVAHPYREYSEVFFGDGYRVLRGGSCATHPRVASPQFRNWDLPQRRQLFAGVRIAR